MVFQDQLWLFPLGLMADLLWDPTYVGASQLPITQSHRRWQFALDILGWVVVTWAVAILVENFFIECCLLVSFLQSPGLASLLVNKPSLVELIYYKRQKRE